MAGETGVTAPAVTESTTQTPSPAAPVETRTDATPAASPKPWDNLKPLAEMSTDERAHFDRHGSLPSPKVQTPAADPEPADPAIVQFVKTPPPPGVSKRQHERNELIRAATERDQRIRDLEAQLQGRATLPAGRTEPPATPPAQPNAQPNAQPPQEFDGIDPRDPKPARKEFDPSAEKYAQDDDAYAAALTDYQLSLWRWEQRREQRISAFRTHVSQQQRAHEERWSGWEQRRETFARENPAGRTAIEPILAQLRTGTPLGDLIVDSPVGPQLALHLAEHPADLTRISGLHWRDQVRELGKLEAKLEGSAPAAASAASVSATPSLPQPKLVSSAPEPGTTLGARPAEPGDVAKDAVARKDFRAFNEAETAKDLARAGRR